MLKKSLEVLLISTMAYSLSAGTAGVESYSKDVEFEAQKGVTITQKRFFLENDKVRLAVIADPGGAVVEFTNKETGVNHVAGNVYKIEKNGKLEIVSGYGWPDWMIDNQTDPESMRLCKLPYVLDVIDAADGAKSIRVKGATQEQGIERTMTLKPDSAELLVNIKVTNIGKKDRPLWIRWHPQILPSKDNLGNSGCVLVSGKDDSIQKIRTATGWDNWFEINENGFAAVADFKSGDGLIITFEKEKVPVIMTWTEYKASSPLRGAVTVEPFAQMKITPPMGSIENSFSYYPFSRSTDISKVTSGVIKDKNEITRFNSFIKKVIPAEHLDKFGAYTFARSEFFDWQHRRRDVFGLRDWGFADCAIVGYPNQSMPVKVRMVGGVFPEAASMSDFPKWDIGTLFKTKIENSKGENFYDSSFLCNFKPGIPGEDTFDRQFSIPINKIPDGAYKISVEAIDPVTKKTFHKYSRKLEVFGNSLKETIKKAREEGFKSESVRPFVKHLSTLPDVKIDADSTEIPLGIEDASGLERKNFPVSLGIPLPAGVFGSTSSMKLESPDGKAVPAQFKTMNVWPDKSLKWIQADFQADCKADSFATYKFSIGKNIKGVAEEKGTILSESGGKIIADSGKIKAVFDSKSPSMQMQVFVDSNKNGKYEPEEEISASLLDNAWWEDTSGNIALMKLEGESSGIFKPGISIEENGPLKATVKLQGWYSDKNGGRPAYGEIRLQFYKNQDFVKIWHNVTFAGNPVSDKLASYGLQIKTKPGIFTKASASIDKKEIPVNGNTLIDQISDDVVNLDAEGKRILQGSKSDGSFEMKGDKYSMLFCHLNFWEMYPKRIEANTSSGDLKISYWPKGAGIHSFSPDFEYYLPSSSSFEACGTGASRTQELLIDFSGVRNVTNVSRFFGEPVVACTPPAWVQKTKVLGNLQPFSMEKGAGIEEYMSLYIDMLDRHRDLYRIFGQWNYGTVHNVYMTSMYQWLNAGRYANIGNEEDIVQAPWLLYFRSGDRKYLKFATIWTKHLMEVQSIRWHNLFPNSAGMSRRHHYTPWLDNADYGHTMLCPFLEYYHASAYAPAWEFAQMTAEAMKLTQKGEWRYISNPICGLIRMYSETGREDYKKEADRIWKELCYPDKNDWWGGSHGSRMARWYSPYSKECADLWLEYARKGASAKDSQYKNMMCTDGMAELFDKTNDIWFAHGARMISDSYESKQMHGLNAIYRGLSPGESTQFTMGEVRMLANAKGAILKSREAFPAGFYNLGYAKEILIKNDTGGGFKIWVGAININPEKDLKLSDAEGKAVNAEVKELFAALTDTGLKGTGGMKFFEISVPDSRNQILKMQGFNLSYFGTSTQKAAIIKDASFPSRSTGSDSLYIRSKDFPSNEISVVFAGIPEASLEIFNADDRVIFSETLLRPEIDAVKEFFKVPLPPDNVLKLGDLRGVQFTNVATVPLYTSKNGTFDLPSSQEMKGIRSK